jgi:hypothetical protein
LKPRSSWRRRGSWRTCAWLALWVCAGDDGVAVPLKLSHDSACVRHTGIIGGPGPVPPGGAVRA